MLALWLWGIDVLIWRKSRINHVFIFNFNPTTALQYHSIFTVHSSGANGGPRFSARR